MLSDFGPVPVPPLGPTPLGPGSSGPAGGPPDGVFSDAAVDENSPNALRRESVTMETASLYGHMYLDTLEGVPRIQTLVLSVSPSLSGGIQEGRCGHPGQEDSAGGPAVGPAAGCPAGSAGLSAGPGTGIQLR